MLKKETGVEFARKVLLENLRKNKGNIKKTAKEMQCSRNTIYLALNKEKEGSLYDKPHIPKSCHPKTTSKDISKKKKRNRFWEKKVKMVYSSKR